MNSRAGKMLYSQVSIAPIHVFQVEERLFITRFFLRKSAFFIPMQFYFTHFFLFFQLFTERNLPTIIFSMQHAKPRTIQFYFKIQNIEFSYV